MFISSLIQRRSVAVCLAPMCLAVLMLSAPPRAQSQPHSQPHSYSQPLPALSADDALTLAESRSQVIKAYGFGAQAAREQSIAARQLPDPIARLGLNNLPITSSDQFSVARDFMTMRSIGVTQEFTAQDKLRSRSMRFEREAEAAEAGQALALANLRRDTLIAWLERHYQERVRALLTVQKDEAALQVLAAEAAYRGGRGGQADIFAARLGVEQIADRIRQADRQVQMAQTRLGRWIGDAATRPLTDAPPMRDPTFDMTGIEQRFEHHPLIAQLTSQESVAQAEVDLASQNRRADWSLELMYSQRGPAYSNMISINASLPLQWDQAHRQERELAAKRALLGQLQAQRAEATREHLAELRSFLQQWNSNQDRLKHYEQSLLVTAAERTQALLTTYRGGTTSLAMVLEARRAEIEIRVEQIRLQMETAELWARLNYFLPPAAQPEQISTTPLKREP